MSHARTLVACIVGNGDLPNTLVSKHSTAYPDEQIVQQVAGQFSVFHNLYAPRQGLRGNR